MCSASRNASSVGQVIACLLVLSQFYLRHFEVCSSSLSHRAAHAGERRWRSMAKVPMSPRGSAAGGRWYGAYPLSTRQVEALMEDRGGEGSTPAPPVGHPVQPAAGGGMPPAPAPGVGPWAEGCNRHEGPRPVALSGAGGGQTRPDHGLAAYRASDTAAARRLLKQSEPPPRAPETLPLDGSATAARSRATAGTRP